MAGKQATIPVRVQPKCTLCWEDFVEPRRLPCKETHIFCTRCILLHIRYQKDGQQFKCPSQNPDCGVWQDVPKGGIDGIRSEFPIVMLGTQDEELSKEEGLRTPLITCHEKGHSDRDATLYCKDHGVVICTRCVTGSHKICTLSQFGDEAQSQKALVEELMKEINRYSEDLEKHIQETTKTFQASDHDLDDLELKVTRSFENICALLSKSKSKLLETIKDVRKQRKQVEISKSQEALSRDVNELKSTSTNIKQESDLRRLFSEVQAFQKKMGEN